MKTREELDQLGRKIVDACVKVHRALGPGLLESTYQICLSHELRSQGIEVRTEVDLPVRYAGVEIRAIACTLFPPRPVLRERVGVRVLRIFEATCDCPGVEIQVGYRIDILVEGCITVENKSVQSIAPVLEAQLITYLKLSGNRLGYLVNWNVPLIKDGIKRIVNNF